jgi:hypothetical protein
LGFSQLRDTGVAQIVKAEQAESWGLAEFGRDGEVPSAVRSVVNLIASRSTSTAAVSNFAITDNGMAAPLGPFKVSASFSRHCLAVAEQDVTQ